MNNPLNFFFTTGQVQKLFTSTKNLFDFRSGGYFFSCTLRICTFYLYSPASRYISHFRYYRSSTILLLQQFTNCRQGFELNSIRIMFKRYYKFYVYHLMKLILNEYVSVLLWVNLKFSSYNKQA